MRRFFTVLFLVSVVATGATYYWRTYQPELTVAASAPQADDSADATAEKRSFSRRSLDAPSAQSYPSVERQPSERQDMAMMISLVSSVISALAAIFQTLLTARSIRGRA